MGSTEVSATGSARRHIAEYFVKMQVFMVVGAFTYLAQRAERRETARRGWRGVDCHGCCWRHGFLRPALIPSLRTTLNLTITTGLGGFDHKSLGHGCALVVVEVVGGPEWQGG
jgi:hypothetical protein